MWCIAEVHIQSCSNGDIAAASDAQSENLTVCNEIKVRNVSTGKEPVQLSNIEGKARVQL